MPTNKHWIKTLYHSILPNRVRCGSRDEFRAFKDSSEIGMKPRLTQTLIDYHPSAPNFSAIRTKSAREEAFVLSHHVAALNFDGGLPRAEFPRVRCRDRRQSNSSATFTLPSNRNTSFQHQQFQEWYASFDAGALICAAAAGDPYRDRSRLRRCSFAAPCGRLRSVPGKVEWDHGNSWDEWLVPAAERLPPSPYPRYV